MNIVADSSPLISFAIIEKLDILPRLFTNIYIPKAVYNEMIIWDKPYSTMLKLFSEGRIKFVQNRLAVDMLRDDLDLGEAEGIVLALENNVNNILIDEHKGRKIARSKGISPIGTIGILIQAKKEGYIPAVKPNLDKLINKKIRISTGLYQSALDLAGEK